MGTVELLTKSEYPLLRDESELKNENQSGPLDRCLAAAVY